MGSENSIGVAQEIIKIVVDFSFPKKFDQLRKFLAFTGFVERFIQNCSLSDRS